MFFFAFIARCDQEIVQRVIFSAVDVLHSWAVPSLGLKCDAIPGRLNQTSLLSKQEGLSYSQCSEVCRINHVLMQTVIVIIKYNLVFQYIS